MIINAFDVNYNPDGTVHTLSVTDYNKYMNVEPSQILNAMLNGDMTSQNIQISVYGLDVLICDVITNIYIDMNKETKSRVRQYLGIEEVKASKQRTKSSSTKSAQLTAKQKAAMEKQAKLEAEREAYRQRQAAWFEENKRKAEEAKAKGLVNLSAEERMRLRAEMGNR